MFRFLIRALLALLILVVAVFLSGRLLDNGQPMPATEESAPPVEVSVLPVSPGRWHPEAVWTGEVVARDDVVVKSPRATEIQSIAVGIADSVEAGALLMSLQPDQWERDRQQARADLEDIKLSIELAEDRHATNQSAMSLQRELLAQAERSLERERNLRSRGASTLAALEDAQSRVTQQRQSMLEAETRVRQFALERAQLVLQRERARRQLDRLAEEGDRLTPAAPFSGRVSTIAVTEGERVSAGAPLLGLYALDSLVWRVSLPVDLTGLEAFLGGEWVSLDRQSATTGDSNSRRQGDFMIPGSQGLVPGEIHAARVRRAARDNAQLLPSTALFGGDRVFLVDEDSRLQEQPVTQLGTARVGDTDYLIIDASVLPENGRILTTRLPDALSGLSVSVSNTLSQPADPGER